MPDSNITKRALASALKELLEEVPFEKISVSDICQKCGMSRKSFYYHFKDKYDLMNWIFDVEFMEKVEPLDYEDLMIFLSNLCSCFYQNRSFYRRAFKIKGQNSFMEHFREMLEPIIQYYFNNSLSDIKNQEFQVHFYSDAFISAFVRWLSAKDCVPSEEFIQMLREVVHVATEINESVLEYEEQEDTDYEP
ncbi:MAG: dihydroxyacetone kinase transcriptional activator DhaS [Clostridiales bacterium]|nr:dihydroxyacetone kinase transcriptional activator DhaS [Clostridiales bacterium]